MLPLSFLPSQKNPSISRFWLLIGVAALAVAGLFSLVLVVARTPSLASLPLFVSLFHESLVVHVNLSVLVWFLSIAAMLWSLLANNTKEIAKPSVLLLEPVGLITFGLGAFVMAASPLVRKGEALMSNYIPVISNGVFFLGLGLLFCGALFIVLHLFISRPKRHPGTNIDGALHFAISGSALAAFVALIAFAWSYRLMPTIITGTQYYEMVFWAGGHILQFVHTQVQMIAWVVLALAILRTPQLNGKLLFALFGIGPLAALFSLYPLLAYDIASMEFRQFYTWLMISANGIAPLLLAIVLLKAGIANVERGLHTRALRYSFIMSLLLFGFGGIFGSMIQGQNVTIPAHYHGSIVSVTLAFMGLAYVLLPQFGYRAVAHWKMAYLQPIIYGLGQLMHISGLAWSGGYGVLRKTPGALEGGFSSAKAAMGLMGMGGLLAIIGGLMFVIVVIKAVWRESPSINNM